MSGWGWAGFAVADLALAGGVVLLGRKLHRGWRETVENWTDDND